MAKTKLVFIFNEKNISKKNISSSKDSKEIFGEKGASLLELANFNIPISPFFIIASDAREKYFELGCTFPKGMWEQVLEVLCSLEKITNKKLGDSEKPLLISCCPSANLPISEMIGCITNIGLNDRTVKGFAKLTKNEWFAYNLYRQSISDFGSKVLKIDAKEFEKILDMEKEKTGTQSDLELTVKSLKQIIRSYKTVIKKAKGKGFPQDPLIQMRMAIIALFCAPPKKQDISEKGNVNIDGRKVAVIITALYHGNTGLRSGSGTVFTRDPRTGEKKLYGEYLINGSRDDFIFGIKGTKSIETLEIDFSMIYTELITVSRNLEQYYQDMQKIDFVIEDNILLVTCVQKGNRTSRGNLKIIYDLFTEGIISKYQLLERTKPFQIEYVLRPRLKTSKKEKPILNGVVAVPGLTYGEVYFSPEKIEEIRKNKSKKVIFVKEFLSLEDLFTSALSDGILTNVGGITSKPIFFMKRFEIPIIVGCCSMKINNEEDSFSCLGGTIHEGDEITLDGSTGNIYKGTELVEFRSVESISYLAGLKKIIFELNSDEFINGQLGKYWLLYDILNHQNYYVDSRKINYQSRLLTLVGDPWIINDVLDYYCYIDIERNKYKDRVKNLQGGSWMLREILDYEHSYIDNERINYLNKIIELVNNDNEKRIIKIKSIESNYKSFDLPNQKFINQVIKTSDCDLTEDDNLIILGIIDTLFRTLSIVGISNHYFYFRPLLNPENYYLNTGTMKIVNEISNKESYYQLVGLEFFNINHFIKNFLELSNVQIWLNVKIDILERDSWRLVKINPHGENIQIGSRRIYGFTIIINGRKLLRKDLYQFFNEFRKREYFWNWFNVHNVTHNEIINMLIRINNGEHVDNSIISALQKLNIITGNGEISKNGGTLILKDTIESRKRECGY